MAVLKIIVFALAVTTVIESAQGVTCKDENQHCASWASQGECKTNPDYMKVNCKKSCKLCGGVTTGGTCVDKQAPHCAGWASTGWCKKNPPWMKLNCAKSCNFCVLPTPPRPTPPKPSPCVDKQAPHCAGWASTGWCQKNPPWMKQNCAKSCNFCGGGGVVTPRPTNPGSWPQYAINALNQHNYYRRIHNSPMMRLDAQMSKSAADWAAKLAKLGKLQNSGAGGENLGIQCDGNQASGTTAVHMWYKSVCKYDFTKGGTVTTFSQLVWKASTKLGIGMAKGRWSGYSCTFWVARYYQPGNMIGAFQQNVFKGSFNKDKFCSK